MPATMRSAAALGGQLGMPIADATVDLRTGSLDTAVAAVIAAPVAAQRHVDSMRGAPFTETTQPPPLVNADNSDVRRSRSYAMQPPVVPHKIDGYQLDKNANRCMFCHSRARTQESQAPMISVTHFIGRDGNFLAELSPRRYFCLQCHVPQAPQEPPAEASLDGARSDVRLEKSAHQQEAPR